MKPSFNLLWDLLELNKIEKIIVTFTYHFDRSKAVFRFQGIEYKIFPKSKSPILYEPVWGPKMYYASFLELLNHCMSNTELLSHYNGMIAGDISHQFLIKTKDRSIAITSN